MATNATLQFRVLETGISFRAKLLLKDNPEVSKELLNHIPMQSMLGHVVISGQTIWFQTKIVHLGQTNMVKRHLGAVYFNSVGGTLCFTYGSITESALVNKVAEVYEDDLPILQNLGKMVYEKTVTHARRSLLRIEVVVLTDICNENLEQSPPKTVLTKPFNSRGQSAIQFINNHTESVWISKPPEIEKISWGIIESGAGSGGQYFSVLVHLKSFLMHMHCDILYNLLKISKYDDLRLETIVRMTRECLEENFNTFDILVDLGITSMRDIGAVYSLALASLSTKSEYRELTGALFIYVCQIQRWIHFIFPWNIGVAFPHRTRAEVTSLSNLLH